MVQPSLPVSQTPWIQHLVITSLRANKPDFHATLYCVYTVCCRQPHGIHTDPLGGDPLGGDPLGGDPLGGKPLGGNPLGCDPFL